MSHYKLQNLPERYFDLKNVPPCDPAGLNDEDKALYELRRKGIEAYLQTRSLRAAADEAKCTTPELLRIFYRFGKMVGNGEIVGWPALVPYQRLEPFSRDSTTDSSSAVGLFSTLLYEHPEIELGLIAAITSAIGGDGRKLSRKTKQEVYRQFKELCGALSITEYPWNTASKAKASVYRYIEAYLPMHTELFPIWFGHASEGRLKVGRAKQSFGLASQPFDLVQIDAHRVDVVATIKIQTADGPKVLAIKRLWLVLLLDVVSCAVLGYAVSFEDQITAETIERAILSSQTPWKPRKLSEGLEYEPYSGLPAGHIEGLNRCPIAALRMDNFSSHYANLVQEHVRKAVGCHIVFGGIGNWWTNAKLERLFRELASRGIHRQSSSTGSGPSDPLRPVNPVGNAIKDAVDIQFVVDLLEVLATGHNGLRGAGRSDMRPLEIINNHIHDPEVALLPRLSPPMHPTAPRLGWEFKRRRIAGSLKAGDIRRPYIEILGRHYTSKELEGRFDLINELANVHTRRADMRVEASMNDGTNFGALMVAGRQPVRAVGMQELTLARKGKNHEDLPEAWVLKAHRDKLIAAAVVDAVGEPGKVSAAAGALAALEQGRASTTAAGGSADPACVESISPSESAPENAARPSVIRPQYGRMRRS